MPTKKKKVLRKKPKTKLPEKTYIARRIFAYLVDIFLIQLVVQWPFKSKINALLQTKQGILQTYSALLSGELVISSELQHVLFIVSVVFVITSLLYFTILEWKLRQTVGKVIFGIYVATTEKKLNLWQVLLRNITKSLALTNLGFLFIIDLLYMIFAKQRLTEKWSKTYVASLR